MRRQGVCCAEVGATRSASSDSHANNARDVWATIELSAVKPHSGEAFPLHSVKRADASAFDTTLSVVIRFHSGGSFALLREALVSLAQQDWNDLELILALQNPADEMEAAVRQLIGEQPWRVAPAVRIVPVQVPAGVDGRSRLLNCGVAAASGRYLAFLDYDDVVYRHGYALLIQQLQRGGCAWAVGGCVKARCVAAGDSWNVAERSRFATLRSVIDLLWRNFIPIHSYVIDRAALEDFEFSFDESLTRFEDYDFLLRLTAHSTPDMSMIDNMVCEYRMRVDGPNSALECHTSPSADAQREWKRCEAIVEKRKDGLRCSVNAAELVAHVQAFVDKDIEIAKLHELLDEHARHVQDQDRMLAAQAAHINQQASLIASLQGQSASLSYRFYRVVRRVARLLSARARSGPPRILLIPRRMSAPTVKLWRIATGAGRR